MGFNNHQDSIQIVRRISTRNLTGLNNANPGSQVKKFVRSHLEEVNCRNEKNDGKKAFCLLPEPEIRVTKAGRQVESSERLFDKSNCMELLCNCKSPSLQSPDGSQDIHESDCQKQSLYDQFPILSLSGSRDASLGSVSKASTFDGSRISPMEEAILVLDGTHRDDSREELGEEEVDMWLHNSVENDVRDFSFGFSESGDSSYERSLCEDSVFEGSCASSSTHDEIPSYAKDLGRTDFLDLEGEDSELVLDREQGYGILEFTDFPSPSYSINRILQYGSSIACCRTSGCEEHETKAMSEKSDLDDPIFWPFDQNSYWHPSVENFLCISPRKNEVYTGVAGVDQSKSIRWRLHQKSNHPTSTRNDQEGYRRKLSFMSTPVSTARGNTRRSVPSTDKISAPSSRLSRLTTNFSSTTRTKQNPHDLKIQDESVGLEDCDFQNLVIEGVPIEKLVGLNEFDGHEGINFDFDEGQFSLIGSPLKTEFNSSKMSRAFGR